MNKICFRGDTREPTTGGSIFQKGFQKWTPSLKLPIVQEDSEYKKNIDILSESAICVTPRLSAAVIFPFYNTEPQYATRNVGPNWLYMMGLDDRTLFNTHAAQVSNALLSEMLATEPNEVMVWLCAQEQAVNEVPAESIIAAISYTRSWRGGNWKDGGTYTLVGGIYHNSNCTVPEPTKTIAEDFLKNELLTHMNDEIAQVGSGFKASVPSPP
jgi:hypothetical protein